MSIGDKLRLIMLPLNRIDQALPDSGLIYELGCGKGTLGAYICKMSPKRKLVGIDIDQSKIALAQKNLSRDSLKFVCADARTYAYEKCEGVVLSDFLHHVDFSSQKMILTQIVRHLKNGGTLIVKEIDKADGVYMWMSRAWDWLLYPHDQIFYRSRKDWYHLLSGLGLTVDVTREVIWFPGSTHVFVCKKN